MKWYWVILILVIAIVATYFITKGKSKDTKTVITIDKGVPDYGNPPPGNQTQRQTAESATRGVRGCNCGQTVTSGNTTTSYRGIWNGSACVQTECN